MHKRGELRLSTNWKSRKHLESNQECTTEDAQLLRLQVRKGRNQCKDADWRLAFAVHKVPAEEQRLRFVAGIGRNRFGAVEGKS